MMLKITNLSASIGDKQILNNVNIELAEGRCLLVTGQNGAGKSTLVKLLVGLYEPQEGEILMNGVNTAQIDMSALRNQISFVTQDTQLFAGTIKCVIHLAIVRGIMYGMAIPRNKVTHFLIIMIGELDLNNKSAFSFL